MQSDTILETKNITKFFPPNIYANYKINFNLRKGEIHALLGENGAGKTTFMRILYGELKPDEGEIYIRGKKIEFKSPRDAILHKIWMVHQHFRLVENLTVMENIALGLSHRIVQPEKEVSPKLRKLIEAYNLDVDINVKIWQLSTGEKQKVEILKALYAGAEIFILDEPTSVLTPVEREVFFKILERLKRNGASIIFITHKLEEALRSDRISVLRKGRLIGTFYPDEVTEKELVQMMVGKEINSMFFSQRMPEKTIGRKILEVKDLWVLGDKGLYSVQRANLEIREGEILGIAGVAGNGQKELAEAIVGLRPVTKGKIYIDGVDVTNKPTRYIYDIGVAFIPEDRVGTGIVPDLSVLDNFILKTYYKPEYTRHKIFLKYSQLSRELKEAVSKYCIMIPDPDFPARTLSGGNIQKLILARELSRKHKLVIALHPTYGLDVATTNMVREILFKESLKGTSILLISEDLEELFMLSDRIAVMYRGKIMGTFDRDEANLETIGFLMAGKNVKVTQAV